MIDIMYIWLTCIDMFVKPLSYVRSVSPYPSPHVLWDKNTLFSIFYLMENKKEKLMSICTNMDIKIRWILVHICYEYDKCSDIFFIFFLTYYHHVIFRFLQGRIDGNKPTFHRCRWDFYCSVCLSFLYVCVCARLCVKTGSPTRWFL